MTDATASMSPLPSAPIAPQPAAAPAAAPSQTLDELMMAMDVVDTLRHQEKLVQAELGQAARDEELKTRLRELYVSQGLTVTDAILDQGLKALKESRFTYQPPQPSWSLSLAKIWVRRTVVGTWSAAALAALGLGWGTYYFGFASPQKAAAERIQVELTTTLPRELEDSYVEAVNLARTDEGQRQAGAFRSNGRWALGRKDIEGFKKELAGLEALRALLLQEYSLRVVAGNKSAVWRIPPDNPKGRNYYLIVQAIDPAGKPVALDITSEETNARHRVDVWGVRVTEAKFNEVKRDKQDDGIIQNNIIAQKKRGYLEPEYSKDVRPAFITEWDE